MILRETYQVDSLENYAMIAKPSIDPARMLHGQLASASSDLLRSLLATFLDTLMSAEADVISGLSHFSGGQGYPGGWGDRDTPDGLVRDS